MTFVMLQSAFTLACNNCVCRCSASAGDKELLKALMQILRILSPPPHMQPITTIFSDPTRMHSASHRAGGSHQSTFGPKRGGPLVGGVVLEEPGGDITRGRSSSCTSVHPIHELSELPPTARVHSMGHIVQVDEPLSPRLNPLHRSLSEASGMNSMGLSGQPVEVHSLVSNDRDPQLTFGLHTMDLVEEEPDIDDTIVQCSVALSNLAQIEEFRAALVADGALELLTRWLDISAEVLSWHNTARLMASTPQAADCDAAANTTSNGVGIDMAVLETADDSERDQRERQSTSSDQFPQTASPSKGVNRSNSACSETATGGVIPPGHPVYELINNISGAVASLTSSSNLPAGAVSASGRDRRHSRQSNYTIGWIDAQVK